MSEFLYSRPEEEANLDKCPTCEGPADNGNDRGVPPSVYECVKCTHEKKNLYVELSDGTYKMPAKMIAHIIATYYVRENPNRVYSVEYRTALEYNDILLFWASKKIPWEDIKKYATKISDNPPADPYEEWPTATKYIG